MMPIGSVNMTYYVTRNVVLEPEDDRAVESLVEKLGLGKRGYSSAVRIIIREWLEAKVDEQRRTQDARLTSEASK